MAYYDPFAADYDVWARDMTDDVGWYVELARGAEEPIVELAFGTGRVGIEVARQTGKRVVGIDASPQMLAIARERIGELPVELSLQDMRSFVLNAPVELITCPFRSVLHLPTWHDRRVLFERVAASLLPGGRFAWNVFAFSPLIAAELHGTRNEREGGLWEEIRYFAADSRIDLTRGRGDETYGTLSLYWATGNEWEGLIDVSGLEVEALYGGFHHEPYGEDWLEQVWVARKPGRLAG